MSRRDHEDAELSHRFRDMRTTESAESVDPAQLVRRALDRPQERAQPGRLRWALAAVAVALVWLAARAAIDPLPPLDPSRAGSLRAATDGLLETPGAALLRGIDLELPGAQAGGLSPGRDGARRESHRTNPNRRSWT